jgi:hypothetical protein
MYNLTHLGSHFVKHPPSLCYHVYCYPNKFCQICNNLVKQSLIFSQDYRCSHECVFTYNIFFSSSYQIIFKCICVIMNHKSAVTFEFLTFPRETDLYSWLWLILKQGVAMHFHMPSFYYHLCTVQRLSITVRGRSYGSWIYNYLCNQCISPLTLLVRILFRQCVLQTTLCDKVCQWLPQVGSFPWVLRFPPPVKLITTI